MHIFNDKSTKFMDVQVAIRIKESYFCKTKPTNLKKPNTGISGQPIVCVSFTI